MKLIFDIVFLDCTGSRQYDRKTLENSPLGGSEASVIRVAEALGGFRLPNGKTLNVAVIKASDKSKGVQVRYFPPTIGQHAYFMHEDEIPNIETKYAVYLRGVQFLGVFPNAKNFVWCHDLADSRMIEWLPYLKEHDATLIAVSRWHKKNIQQVIDYDKISYVYNPVQDDIYLPAYNTRTDINKNLMVWAASPHKGLDEALETFKKINSKFPSLRLLVYNPGYMKGDIIINPGVLYYGPTACKNVWHQMKNALCVFYPTKFQETFGLIAAEANALGCPVLTYKEGALNEVIQDDRQTVESEEVLLQQLEKWYTEGPPVIHGRDDFRLSKIAMKWLAVLAGRL